jgi:hypothetical protein
MAKRRGIAAPVPQRQPGTGSDAGERRSAITAAVPEGRGQVWLEGPGGPWLLDGTRLLIGRAQGGVGADVEVDDDSVSRRHAELVATPGGWEIRDLGSVNGTSVDGVRVLRGASTAVGAEQVVRVGVAELRIVRR